MVSAAMSGGVSRSDFRHVMKITTPYELINEILIICEMHSIQPITAKGINAAFSGSGRRRQPERLQTFFENHNAVRAYKLSTD